METIEVEQSTPVPAITQAHGKDPNISTTHNPPKIKQNLLLVVKTLAIESDTVKFGNILQNLLIQMVIKKVSWGQNTITVIKTLLCLS